MLQRPMKLVKEHILLWRKNSDLNFWQYLKYIVKYVSHGKLGYTSHCVCLSTARLTICENTSWEPIIIWKLSLWCHRYLYIITTIKEAYSWFLWRPREQLPWDHPRKLVWLGIHLGTLYLSSTCQKRNVHPQMNSHIWCLSLKFKETRPGRNKLIEEALWTKYELYIPHKMVLDER